MDQQKTELKQTEQAGMYELKQVNVWLKLGEGEPLYCPTMVRDPETAAKVMIEMMRQLDREQVCVVNFDSRMHPLNYNVVSIGDINSSNMSLQSLYKSSILSNSSRIMLFHNHPSGDPSPSMDDHIVTARVMMASEFMGIPLLDHIIVGGVTGEYYSYREQMGCMFNLTGMRDFLGKHSTFEAIMCVSEKYAESNRKQLSKEKMPKDQHPKEQPSKEKSVREKPSLRKRMKEKKAIVETGRQATKSKEKQPKTERAV